MAGRPFARQLGFAYLILCGLVVLALVGFKIYEKFGPAKFKTENIPFGLPANSAIQYGDAPRFDEAIQALPYATRGEMERAKDLAQNGYYIQALEIYDAIALTYPDLEAARFGALEALFDADSLNESEKIRQETLLEYSKKRYAGTSLAAYWDSRRAYLAGSLSTALDLAQTASKNAQAFTAFRLWYAKLLLENSQNTLAVQEARASISLSFGNSPRAYELLAEAFHASGLLDSCAAVTEYGLSKFPTNSNLLLLHGYLEEYRGNFDAAEKVYLKISTLHPNFKQAPQALATLGEKSPPGNGEHVTITPADRARVACDILEPLVIQYPENLPLREALGRAYLKARNFDAARLQFSEIEQKDPEYPEIRLRLQEATATRVSAEYNANNGLTENLNRVADSLRTALPATKHDFTSKLGHYLVRYGASPKEFFTHYAITNFKQIKPHIWQEHFVEDHLSHTYTVLFDDKNRFYGVHVLVTDSSLSGRELGRAPEIFTRLLSQNSRISGIGSATGETECEEAVIDAAVWDGQDNFEIIARIIGKPEEVRMVRFDKNFLPMGLKLCDYLPYLNAY